MVEKPKSAEMRFGPGFRIRTRITRPPEDVVAGLSEFASPEISDVMNRLYTMRPEIRCLTDPELALCGPACTVKVYPGDNLMVHKCLDIVQPGDVVVVDTCGSEMTAVLGDLICTKARHRGIRGFVVDGLIRDLPAILRLGGISVFARDVTPIGPLHRGPGEINYPIAAGGIVVHPGDVIAADLNGVVVVPQDSAGAVLEELRRRRDAEREYTEAVARGDFSNAWVDTILSQNGVSIDAEDG